MKLFSKTIILSFIFFASCQINSNDKDAAQRLFELIEGSGEFSLVTNKLIHEDSLGRQFIEIEITESKLLESENMNKELVASLCADFLYYNLESERTQESHGINVVYRDDNFVLNMDKPYYYTMSELTIINNHYRTIGNFLESFKLGSEPTDFLNESLSKSDSVQNAKVIKEIDSVGYFDAKLATFFHQRLDDPKKLLIIGLYKLKSLNQIAIQYTVDRRSVKNPIYTLEIRK